MKLAILGFGTVGRGVYEMLEECPLFDIGSVLVRPGKVDAPYKVDNIEAICQDRSIDAVVEVLGGIEPAFFYCAAALKAGKHVVTSNKALVAAKGLELDALARENGVGFLFSAACGGAVPFLHNLELARRSDAILSLGGILNGTTNFMLDKMQSEGGEYAEVLKEAQALGYAEADPTADVTGLDALRKIMLACAVAYDQLPTEGLLNEGIDSLSADDVRDLQKRGLVCRLLAKGGLAEGKLYAYVQPALLSPDAPEAAVKKNFNMAKYIGKNAGQIVLMGQGAGRYPTASAVLRDLECLTHGQREMLHEDCRAVKADNGSCQCSYYIRLPREFAGNFDFIERGDGDTVRGITNKLSVAEMHEKVRSLRKAGARIFFAERN